MSGAFIDVSCPKCGRKFGWFGRMANRPPCPRCGDAVPRSELDAIDARMDADRALIDSRPDAKICREQRVLAGITLRQAAKLLGVMPSQLSDYENGRAELPPDVATKMAGVYCVGPEIGGEG